MKTLLYPIFLSLFAALLAGCIPEEATGFYDAPNGDSLSIEKDGHVVWSPPAKDSSKATSLGILSLNRKSMTAHLTMASANPHIGTEIRFSNDLETITLNWQRLDGTPIEGRATEYKKRK